MDGPQGCPLVSWRKARRIFGVPLDSVFTPDKECSGPLSSLVLFDFIVYEVSLCFSGLYFYSGFDHM